MVAPQATPPPSDTTGPTLADTSFSPLDIRLIEAFLDTGLSREHLGAAIGRSLPTIDLLSWLEQPHIAAVLNSYRRAAAAANELCLAHARFAAIARLGHIAATSKDEVQARRAASSLLRFRDPGSEPRQAPSPPPAEPAPRETASQDAHERASKRELRPALTVVSQSGAVPRPAAPSGDRPAPDDLADGLPHDSTSVDLGHPALSDAARDRSVDRPVDDRSPSLATDQAGEHCPGTGPSSQRAPPAPVGHEVWVVAQG